MNYRQNKIVATMSSRPGITLVEMIVAVALTLIMLTISGVVFKSATLATGKAQAGNEIMQQLRALTAQIDADFQGFRPDMPFAVVWEAHRNNLSDPQPYKGDMGIDKNDRWVRYDRIVFFTNGDFQIPNGPYGYTDGNISSNLARVYYGQSYDSPTLQQEIMDVGNNYLQRYILTRRQAVITADMNTNFSLPYANKWIDYIWTGISNNGYNSLITPWFVADYCPIDYVPAALTSSPLTSINFWKNVPFNDTTPAKISYYNHYFNQYFTTTDSYPAFSLIRRTDINVMADYAADGVQRLFMLPDVTDFKIELLFPPHPDPAVIRPQWFPNPSAVNCISGPLCLDYVMPFYGIDRKRNMPQQFAFYWNAQYYNDPLATPVLPGGWTPASGLPINEPPAPFGYEVTWRHERDLRVIAADAQGAGLPLGWNPNDMWPRAVKFTFTLYDKNRRYYPLGQTYEYIVKLPPRI